MYLSYEFLILLSPSAGLGLSENGNEKGNLVVYEGSSPLRQAELSYSQDRQAEQRSSLVRTSPS